MSNDGLSTNEKVNLLFKNFMNFTSTLDSKQFYEETALANNTNIFSDNILSSLPPISPSYDSVTEITTISSLLENGISDISVNAAWYNDKTKNSSSQSIGTFQKEASNVILRMEKIKLDYVNNGGAAFVCIDNNGTNILQNIIPSNYASSGYSISLEYEKTSGVLKPIGWLATRSQLAANAYVGSSVDFGGALFDAKNGIITFYDVNGDPATVFGSAKFYFTATKYVGSMGAGSSGVLGDSVNVLETTTATHTADISSINGTVSDLSANVYDMSSNFGTRAISAVSDATDIVLGGTPTAPTATSSTDSTTQIATTAFVQSAISSSSQWTTVNTDDVTYTSGNVGIGSATPSQALDVSGNIIATGDLTATNIGGTLTTASQPNVTTMAGLTSVGTLTDLTVTNSIAGSVTGSAVTVTGDAQTAITSVGTLTGLTVTNPIAGSVTGSAATVTDAAQTAITSVGTLSDLTISATNDVTITTADNKNILLQPGGTGDGPEKVHIKGSLTVDGSINFTGGFVQTNTNVQITDQLDISNNGTGPALIARQHGTNNIADFYDDDALAMRIANGGNVGIGITNPSYKLDVSGTSQFRDNVDVNGITFHNEGYSASSPIYYHSLSTGSLPTGWEKSANASVLPNSLRLYGSTNIVTDVINLSQHVFFTDDVGDGNTTTITTSSRILLKVMGKSHKQDKASEKMHIQLLDSADNSVIDTIYREYTRVQNDNHDFNPIICDLKPYIKYGRSSFKIRFYQPTTSGGFADYFEFKQFTICKDDSSPWYKNSVYKQQILGGLSIGTGDYIGRNLSSQELLVEGNVGIGTDSPSQALDVNGSARIANKLYATDLSAQTLSIHGDSSFNTDVRIMGNLILDGSFNGAGSAPKLTISTRTGTTNNIDFTDISAIRFDTDSGFAIDDLSNGEVKIKMNSTYKTWKVDGQTDLVAEGLDTMNFASDKHIDITTSTAGGNKTITFGVNHLDASFSEVQTTLDGKQDTLTFNAPSTNNANPSTSAQIKTALDLKANIASPTFTGTVAGITKAMVDLSNVDNTTDALKPVSTAQQTALNLKANLASPTFTGIPIAPTASSSNSTTQLATTAFVQARVTEIIGAAPAALDTLNELAAALGDDANFSGTVTNSLSLKANIASPTFTGNVSGITKAMVGLTNVDDTTDASKPISTAQQTALDLKANIASPTFTGNVSGITKAMVGLTNVDDTTDASKPISTAQQTALDLKANIASPTFTGNVSGITKAMVGLTNVDDTTDTSKPVSTAQQTALDLKQDTIGDGDLTIAKTNGLQAKLTDLSSNKQDTLTAGRNIVIEGSTISAEANTNFVSLNVEELTVTVASKTSLHPNQGGSTSAFFINNKEAPILTLVSGKTYKFLVNDGTNSGHPLRFYTTEDNTTQHTTGFTYSGASGNANAYVQLVVTDTTPKKLYYQCSSHSYMGNVIFVEGYANIFDDELTIAKTSGLQTALTAKQDNLYFGILNTNSVVIDGTAILADYAKFTSSGIEGRTSGEVKNDLTLNLVENIALSTWAGSSNITTTGVLTDLSVNATNNVIISTAQNKDILLQPGGSTDGDEKVHIKGDLIVDGSINFTGGFIQTNTNVQVTDQLDISNNGTGPALIARQYGDNDIADFYDDNSLAVRIANGGNVGIGTDSPSEKLHVEGNIKATNIEGALTTAAQTAITSVGILTQLEVTADSSFNAGLYVAGDLTATNVAGTLTTPSQTAITSVGILTQLEVTADSSFNNDLYIGGDLTATNISGTLTTPSQTAITSVGTLTELEVVSDSSFNAHLHVGGDLTATNIAGTLTTPSQSAITSVGTLTELEVTTDSSFNAGLYVAGDLTATNVAGTLTTPSQTAITSVGTLTKLEVTADSSFNADLYVAGDLTATNVAGTLTTGSQPNVNTMSNLVTVGALNTGSITSGFTSIDVGSGLIAGGDLSGNKLSIESDSSFNSNVYIQGDLSATNIDGTITTAIQNGIQTMSNLTAVSALDSGSITSGFGSIDIGTDSITGGAITGSSLSAGSATGEITGKLVSANQSNITSVGTLSDLTISATTDVTITTADNTDIFLQPGGTGDGPEKVHIKGSLTVDGSINFTGGFVQTNTNVQITDQLDISNNGTGPALIARQHGTADVAAFYDDSAIAMVIKNGGNVGIGTDSPSKTLDVGGTAVISKYIDNHTDHQHTVLKLNQEKVIDSQSWGKPILTLDWAPEMSSHSSARSLKWSFGQGGVTGVNGLTSTLGLGYASSGSYDWAPQFYFTSNGNLGIAARAPTEKLEVNGNIRINNGQSNGNTQGGKLLFDDAYNKAGPNKIVVHSAGYGFGVDQNTLKYNSPLEHKFYVGSGATANGNLALQILDNTDVSMNGAVINGDVSMNSGAYIAGAAKMHGGAYITGDFSGMDNTQTSGIYLGVKSSNNAMMQMVSTTNNTGWIDWTSTNSSDADYEGRIGYSLADSNGNHKAGFNFYTDSLHRMNIDHITGNVGIGITNPTQKLDVSGTMNVSGNVGIGMTNPAVKLDITSPDTFGSAHKPAINTLTGDKFSATPGQSFTWITLQNLSDSGNSQIGANQLFDQLSINAINYNSGGSGQYGQNNRVKTGMGFSTRNNATVNQNALAIDYRGYVGIGTTTPSVALDVIGAINATGVITGTSLSAGTASGNITGKLTSGSANQSNITTIGTLSDLTVTATNDVVISTADNRDIFLQPGGTGDGPEKVHIKGSLTVDGSINFTGGFVQTNTNVQITDQLDISNNGTGPALIARQYGTADVAAFYDDSAIAMVIKGGSTDGGNVGIGTDSPTEKLDVNGNILSTNAHTTTTTSVGDLSINSTGFVTTTTNSITLQPGGPDISTVKDQKVHIKGDLVVDGSINFTGQNTFQSDVNITEKFDISFSGTGTALTVRGINNTGAIAKFYNEDTLAMVINGSAGEPGRVGIGTNTIPDSEYTKNPLLSVNSPIYTNGLISIGEFGALPAAILFSDGSTMGYDQISLITSGEKRLYVGSSGKVTIYQDLSVNGVLEVDGGIIGTLTTATQNNITTMTGLTSVGALDSGSITSGFGSINIGTSTITSGAINAGSDTNTTSYLGRAAIGFVNGVSDYASFAHYDRNNTNDYALLQSSDGKTILNCNSAKSISFKVGNVDKMRLDSNGKLGIGTTDPSHKLHVIGNISGTNLYGTIATASQPDVTTMSNLVTIGTLNSGSITSGFGSINVGTDSITGGAITGSSLSAGSASGNITGKLTAASANQSNITTVGTLNGGSISSGFGNINVGTNSVTAGSFIGTIATASQYYITTIGTLSDLNVNATNDVTITTASNKNILLQPGGTGDGPEKVHIKGSLTVDGSINFTGGFVQTNTNVQITDQLDISNNGTGPALIARQHGANNIADFYDDNALAMRIANGGNVGIGTTNPTQKLEVNGNIFINNGQGGQLIFDKEFGAGGSNKIRLFGTDTGYGFGVDSYTLKYLSVKYHNFYTDSGASSNGNLALQILDNKDVRMYGGAIITGASRMHGGAYIAGDIGNMNTANTPPGVYLGTLSSSSTKYAMMQMVSNTGIGGWIDWTDNTGNSDFEGRIRYSTTDSTGNHKAGFNFFTNSLQRMVIDTTGNVGIGITNPSATLDVNGTMNVTTDLTVNDAYIGNGYYSSNGFATFSHNSHKASNSDYAVLQDSDGRTIINSSLATQIEFRNASNSTAADKMVFKGGKLGIGRTAPAQALDVNGHINISKSGGNGAQGGLLLFDSTYNKVGSNKIRLHSSYGFGVDGGTLKYLSAGISHKWYYEAPDTFANNGTLGMHLQSGSLGIGTDANTSYGLDVSGHINFSGDLYKNGSAYISSQWTTVNTDDITYTSGNVGIGTNPGNNHEFDVSGDINFSGNLYKDGSLFSNAGLITVNSDTAGEMTFDSNDFAVSVNASIATIALKSSIDTIHISGDASFNGDVLMNSNLQVNGIVTQF